MFHLVTIYILCSLRESSRSKINEFSNINSFFLLVTLTPTQNILWGFSQTVLPLGLLCEPSHDKYYTLFIIMPSQNEILFPSQTFNTISASTSDSKVID